MSKTFVHVLTIFLFATLAAVVSTHAQGCTFSVVGNTATPTHLFSPPPRPPCGECAEPKPSSLFWVAVGPDAEYEEVSTTLVDETSHFRVWAEDNTEVASNLMMAAVQEAESAITSGVLGAQIRVCKNKGCVSFPIDVVFASLQAMGGYVSSADIRSDLHSPFSNGAGTLYVGTASCSRVTGCPAALVAHELQHLLQYSLDPQEATWVNEGLSEIVEREVSGEQDGEEVLRCTDFNLARWPLQDTFARLYYRSGYEFLLWWRSEFGQEALESIATSAEHGALAFEEVAQMPFDQIFMSWERTRMLPLFQDQKNVSSTSFSCPGVSYHELGKDVSHLSDTVSQYGCDLVEIPPDKPLILEFTGNTLVSIMPPPSNEQDFWWSGTAPNSHATLTTQIDLTGMRNPALRFYTWYEIESGYDWAYVAISTDEGESWTYLESERTSQDNLRGTNPGSGYTGASNEWQEERIPLTEFAGKQALLRFGYLSDDSVEGTGFAISDVVIEAGATVIMPQIWQNYAFTKQESDQSLKQEFSALLLSSGPDAQYSWILPVDASGVTHWRLPVSGNGSRKAIMICALTGEAWEPAYYSLSLKLLE